MRLQSLIFKISLLRNEEVSKFNFVPYAFVKLWQLLIFNGRFLRFRLRNLIVYTSSTLSPRVLLIFFLNAKWHLNTKLGNGDRGQSFNVHLLSVIWCKKIRLSMWLNQAQISLGQFQKTTAQKKIALRNFASGVLFTQDGINFGDTTFLNKKPTIVVWCVYTDNIYVRKSFVARIEKLC